MILTYQKQEPNRFGTSIISGYFRKRKMKTVNLGLGSLSSAFLLQSPEECSCQLVSSGAPYRLQVYRKLISV